MRNAWCTMVLVLLIGSLGYSQRHYPAFDNTPLPKILDTIAAQYDVTFSYDVAQVEPYTIQISEGIHSLSSILDAVLSQTRLDYEIIDVHNILIYPRTKTSAQSLCGYILDADTQKPIAYASIYCNTRQCSSESDASGYFEINAGPQDTVMISYLGYDTRSVPVASVIIDDCDTYMMSTATISFAPIILTEYLSDGISQSTGATAIILAPDHMDVLPGSVEQDVMSALQFLPGISTPNESLDALTVRGGTPDQNLVLYDHIPMYHTSHFFGSFSAFNPFIIDQVSVYRSGIGSEFGGRVSSVIDIQSETEVTKKGHIHAGVNLTHMYANTNLPLWKGASAIISLRRSITDVWNTPTFVNYAEKVFQGTNVENTDFNNPSLAFNDEFRFDDANFKFMWEVGKNKFVLSSIGALNRLNYRSDVPNFNAFAVDLLNLRNSGVSISWDRHWSSVYKSSLIFTDSEYDYDYNLSYRLVGQEMKDPLISIDTRNKIIDGGLIWRNDYILSEEQAIKFGYQLTENRIKLAFASREFNKEESSSETFRNTLHALFAEYALDLPSKLHLDLGLRYQYSQQIKNNYFEPRISLTTDMNDHFKLKVSTSKHFQFVSQLVGFDINQLGLSNQIWVASNNKLIPVIESNQWMGGFLYKKDKWTIDLEGYVKELDGITTLTNNFVALPEQPPFSIGKSRIRGIDVLLKRRSGRHRQWISYTLSQTLYEFFTLGAEAVPATHDQTHIIQAVETYHSGSWEFSLGLMLRSGLPSTVADGVIGETDASGEEVFSIAYQKVNAARLEPYGRLDASIIYNFGNPQKFHGFIGFSVQNLFNRENVLGTQYLLGEPAPDGIPELLSIDELGLRATPNLSINLRY